VDGILAKALGEDVTKLAAGEKQRLLSRLLARLAHEIRNPLSSLDIHVQLLEEDLTQLAPQAKEKLSCRLEIIHGELHRLENIVKQFIRLAGPSALDLAPVEPAKVIAHVCNLLQPEAAARQIQMVTQVDGHLPTLVADAGQLIQALLNLVINALQAVERKGRVELRAKRAGNSLVIEVCDSGAGIPLERLGAIFEPYYTTKPEGSGIGLWIAQQIITAHGGTIQTTTAPTGGAVFAIHLPLQPKEKSNG
jgi:two-component system sensor histidine kinase HydH